MLDAAHLAHRHDQLSTLPPGPRSPVVAELVAGLVSGICTGAARSGPLAAGHVVAQTVERRLTAERERERESYHHGQE